MLKTKECKHGTFTYHTTDFWIGGALEAVGQYSEDEVAKLLSLINENSVVVEVGANIGTITVPMAKAAAKVYAYEPQPKTHALLARNVEQNGLLNKVHIYSVALSDKEGETFISDVDYDAEKLNGGSASLNDNGGVQVKKTTLDSEFTIDERIDLIKIDVEGHELEVLKGGIETITRHKPFIYVENDRSEKSEALIAELFDLGYDCYWHFPALYNPDPMIRDDSFVSVNMLCLSLIHI